MVISQFLFIDGLELPILFIKQLCTVEAFEDVSTKSFFQSTSSFWCGHQSECVRIKMTSNCPRGAVPLSVIFYNLTNHSNGGERCKLIVISSNSTR